jgi:hypothetical protein
MKETKPSRSYACLAAFALLPGLISCGGGNDDGNKSSTEVSNTPVSTAPVALAPRVPVVPAPPTAVVSGPITAVAPEPRIPVVPVSPIPVVPAPPTPVVSAPPPQSPPLTSVVTPVSPPGAVPCERYNDVRSGFLGDLNAEGAQGGDPGGDGSSGSAGVGGGLGKVLGAKVEVFRLRDGLQFGRGEEVFTDRTTGLVTVQTCNVNEPMLVVLRGVVGAKYYDEGKNALLPFGPDQVLHALVGEVKGNIGVSALTEAAYRHAINNFLIDPSKVANRSTALRKTAPLTELSKLTPSQIAMANQRVKDEVNRILPSNYQLTSVTALPTPLGLDNQRADLLPKNQYGQAAVVTGALSWTADKFRIGTAQPALAISEELSRDLTDGKVDGLALDRSKAATTAASYESVALPINLTVGANVIAKQFSAINLGSAYEFADINSFREPMVSCDFDNVEVRYALTKNGTIDLRRKKFVKCQPAADPAVIDTAFTQTAGSDIKEIFTSQYSGGGFFVKANGQVFSWGDSTCGQIGNGQSAGIQSLPKVIAGLNNITSLANGYYFAIARDNDGRVYSWGSNESSALGLGSNPPLDATCGSSSLNAVTTPKLVPGLTDISQVFAFGFRAWALNKTGRLYTWGSSCGRGGGGPSSNTPVLLAQPTGVRAMAANERGCFAVKDDGTLVGWGFYNNIDHGGGRVYNDGQWFGDGSSTPKVSPTSLPGLRDVREIASDQYYFYALTGDGTVWRWGGELGKLRFDVPTPITGIPELTAGKKVLIRHMKSDINGVHLFAEDGRLFVAHSWAAEPSYLIDLAVSLGFK